MTMARRPHPDSVKAGRIAARVLGETCEAVRPGAKIISICALAEKRILELGGRPAFPCNVSVNEVAAHYTSPKNDPSVIPDFGVVKVDVGVHINGHIADTARTVDLDGTLDALVDASAEALHEAISFIRPGVTVGEVGAVIERVIKDYGLRPVRELTGHSLKRYALHAGKQIPNVKTRDSTPILAGEYYAIEPFATTGSRVVDSKQMYIFSNNPVDKPLTGVTEKLRLHLRKSYGPLPFASRWIGVSQKGIQLAEELKKLLRAKAIRGYPVLVEKRGGLVSQTEHTVFVSEDGATILTE